LLGPGEGNYDISVRQKTFNPAITSQGRLEGEIDHDILTQGIHAMGGFGIHTCDCVAKPV
jgi:hypothetical protein